MGKVFGQLQQETPPRAWGRRRDKAKELKDERNTPTGVGKTTRVIVPLPPREKHPHGRGEDEYHEKRALQREETPPRAWGRPVQNRS